MTITRRCLALCGAMAVLVACGNTNDYRAMTPAEVCALLPLEQARDLMKDITDDTLTAQEETSVKLPGCRYGSEEGKPYLRVSIYQSSRVKDSDEVVGITLAGQKALERDGGGSCSVLVPLEENLYLLTIVEAWDEDRKPCPVARKATETAYPALESESR